MLPIPEDFPDNFSFPFHSIVLLVPFSPFPLLQILIGIMTAAKYVDTRAYTVWRTWAQSIPGRVLFFVAENTQSIHADMPLVRLKGVDDTYPPQKKSFAMLRWMADRQVRKGEGAEGKGWDGGEGKAPVFSRHFCIPSVFLFPSPGRLCVRDSPQ